MENFANWRLLREKFYLKQNEINMLTTRYSALLKELKEYLKYNKDETFEYSSNDGTISISIGDNKTAFCHFDDYGEPYQRLFVAPKELNLLEMTVDEYMSIHSYMCKLVGEEEE